MADYLRSHLRFFEDRIEVADSKEQVMMAWERPLMRRMAEIAASRRGDVLEIGFGMGLSCTEVQRLGPRSHTIVEAHPEILERARSWAAERPGVRIVGGRWQDVLSELETYDGISFDVFGGSAERLRFFERLPSLLRPGGVATLWLGDDEDVPAPLAEVLRAGGFTWTLSRVTALPDPRCTYSRSNRFVIPAIRYQTEADLNPG